MEGCRHLVGRYKKYGSWAEAIYFYNGQGQEALEYLAVVFEKERGYEELFNKEWYNGRE